MTQFNEETNPKINELLAGLSNAPQRDEQAAKRTRHNFMAEVNSLAGSPRPQPWHARLTAAVETLAARPALRPALAALLLATALFFSAASGVANAAQKALPGDGLYPVKLMIETGTLAFSFSANSDLQFHLAFAQNRLDEISSLQSSQSQADLSGAIASYQTHIQAARQLSAQVDAATASQAEQTLAALDSTFARISSTAADQTPTSELEGGPKSGIQTGLDDDGAEENPADSSAASETQPTESGVSDSGGSETDDSESDDKDDDHDSESGSSDDDDDDEADDDEEDDDDRCSEDDSDEDATPESCDETKDSWDDDEKDDD